MGLVYITYGGGTPFHLDAGGEMDSGHICLKGYNEVIVVRRMTAGTLQNLMNSLTKSKVQKKGSSSKAVSTLASSLPCP